MNIYGPYLTYLLILVTAAFALGRFTVPGRPVSQFGWPLTYEALVHVWCGVLVGLSFDPKYRRPCLLLLTALVVLEVVKGAMVPK